MLNRECLKNFAKQRLQPALILLLCTVCLNVSALSAPHTSNTKGFNPAASASHLISNQPAQATLGTQQKSFVENTLSRASDGTSHRFETQNVYNEFGFLVEVRDFNENEALWHSPEVDALGNIVKYSLGNGVLTERVVDSINGRTTAILTDKGNGEAVQNLHYQWDQLGNLQARGDYVNVSAESFSYDKGYRVSATHRYIDGNINAAFATQDGTGSIQSEPYRYQSNGNVFAKGRLVGFEYDSQQSNGDTRPHAVSRATALPGGSRSYTYDANGNLQTASAGTSPYSVTWNSFNKPSIIEGSGADRSEFHYGPNRSRYRHIKTTEEGHNKTVTYIGGAYEKHELKSGTTALTELIEHHHYIRAGGRVIAVNKVESDLLGDLDHDGSVNFADLGLLKAEFFSNDAATDLNHDGVVNFADLGILKGQFFSAIEVEPTDEYWHRDHLDSITAITDESGEVINQRSFGPWGKHRDSVEHEQISPLPGLFIALEKTDRGFTGHEQLTHLGLIHMNGRIYDIEIGRFLSPDVFVQFPESAQNYNRYTYVNNNPLSYNDPSGHVIETVAAIVTYSVAAYSVVNAAVQGYEANGWKGALGGAIKAGTISLASMGLAAGIGGWASNAYGTSISGWSTGQLAFVSGLHGVSQGMMSMMGGGRFADGFLGGAASKFLSPLTESLGGEYKTGGPIGVAKRAAISAVIGGTASTLGGGKFANGAISAAVVSIFNGDRPTNDERHLKLSTDLSDESQARLAERAAAVDRATTELEDTAQKKCWSRCDHFTSDRTLTEESAAQLTKQFKAMKVVSYLEVVQNFKNDPGGTVFDFLVGGPNEIPTLAAGDIIVETLTVQHPMVGIPNQLQPSSAPRHSYAIIKANPRGEVEKY